MPITTDIICVWKTPRRFIRAKLEYGQREDRVLAVLMGASTLIFLSQWPNLLRQAQFAPDIPLDARLGGALFASLFLFPLFAYAMAALSRVIVWVLSRKGSWFASRVALFWALLAISPLMLLNGVLSGLIGPGILTQIYGIIVLVSFLYLWFNMLIGAEG